MRDMDEERENIDDDRTTDRYLRSLRRHRRVQMEEIEKARLIKEIKEYEQRRATLLTKIRQEKAFLMRKKVNANFNILKAKQFMIPKRPRSRQNSGGFL